MLRPLLVAALLGTALPGCSSSPSAAPSGLPRATSDPRVRSFLGQVPPEITADVRWLNAQPASLATQRGRVVFLQFAFPT